MFTKIAAVAAALVLLAGLVEASSVTAQEAAISPPAEGGGPIADVPMDDDAAEIDAVHAEALATAARLGLDKRTPRVSRAPALQFPLRLEPLSRGFRGNGITNYVDLAADAAIKDFACGSRSYDGHNGIDFAIWPWAWRMMDAGEVSVVAAAGGTIVAKQDGQFDRQCTWGGVQPANYVVVRQDDGYFAYYWHLRKASVTPKAVGDRVTSGEQLGMVGSSGRSTGPHLHLEMRTAGDFSGTREDPFAGACGSRQTMWRHQAETVDTEVLRIATHNVTPVPYGQTSCENPALSYTDSFGVGTRMYGAVYLRDQRPDTLVTFSFVSPAGKVMKTWTSFAIPTVYSRSFWYSYFDIPPKGSKGRWNLRIAFDGKTYERPFFVGAGLPAATTLSASVSPLSVKASPTAPAKLMVVIKNSGAALAVGCNVVLEAPLAAVWHATATAGSADKSFDVAPGASRSVQVSLAPKSSAKAIGYQVPVRVTCENAGGPATQDGVNLVTVTF